MAETVPTPPEAPGSRPHRDKEAASWIVGVALILFGVAFILQNAGFVTLAGNWWALFIYLASTASFAKTWRSYRAEGEFGSAATGSLIWGLVLAVVASILFFNLAWDLWWPTVLVAVGAGMVVGYVLGHRE